MPSAPDSSKCACAPIVRVCTSSRWTGPPSTSGDYAMHQLPRAIKLALAGSPPGLRQRPTCGRCAGWSAPAREPAIRGWGCAQAPRLTKVTLTSDALPELSGSGGGAKLITPLPLQGTVTEVGIGAFTP